MSYAIMRIEKAKTMANVGSRAAHNMRQHPTAAPHADPEKRGMNRVFVGPSDAPGVVSAVKKKLASVPKFRKDAVRAVEVLMTAGPDFFDSAKSERKKWSAWLAGSMAWLENTWGAENIVSVVLHQDEATPHLQAIVVPVHDGKLRASHWLDGPAKLSKLQDGYAAATQAQGLIRGERNSLASHTSLSKFYNLANRIEKAVNAVDNEVPSLPVRGILGRISNEDWKRLEADIKSYGAEGLKLRSESVAAQLMASGSIAEEQRKRTKEAERRRRDAELTLSKLEKDLKISEQLLSKIKNDYNNLHRQNTDLSLEIEQKRDVLQLGQLERYRDELVNEIQRLQPRM